VIGDAPRDVQAGQAAGCRTILVQPTGLPTSPAAEEKLTAPPDYIAANLKEAMAFVEKHLDVPTPGEPESSAPPQPQPVPHAAGTRLDQIAEQILLELRKRNQDHGYSDFSVSKLMAGIVQVMTIAMLFLAYLNKTEANSFEAFMLGAIFMQVFTIALLIMGKQK
jgi:hypothetical protein